MECVQGINKGEVNRIGANHHDADFLVLFWNKINDVRDNGIWLKVVWSEKGHKKKWSGLTWRSEQKETTIASGKADELAKKGAEADRAIPAVQAAMDVHKLHQKIYAAMRYATTFHVGADDDGDMEETTVEGSGFFQLRGREYKKARDAEMCYGKQNLSWSSVWK